jgi:hypothetical protein
VVFGMIHHQGGGPLGNPSATEFLRPPFCDIITIDVVEGD